MHSADFKDPFHGGNGVFQFTMEHLESGLLFRCDEDFVFGVNTLALGILKHPVKLLAYVLMDNHLHLLLAGKYDPCLAYYYWVLKRLRFMLHTRYGRSGILKDEAVDITAVTDERMFINELAYIFRNPYKARSSAPNSYRWSSAADCFNPWREHVRGTPAGTLAKVEIRALLQTRITVPDEWEILDGCILNRFFVDYALVEKKIGDSVRLFDRVRIYDLETSVNLSHGLHESITFTDIQMTEKMIAVCRNEYHVSSPAQLDRKTLLLLARTMARRFSATKKQISRLLDLSEDVLDQLL